MKQPYEMYLIDSMKMGTKIYNMEKYFIGSNWFTDEVMGQTPTITFTLIPRVVDFQ